MTTSGLLDAANPLLQGLQGLREEATAPPCAMVVFGASGDLATRKIFPALYQMVRRGELPANFSVVGVARTPLDDDAFRQAVQEAVTANGDADAAGNTEWTDIVSGFRYVAGEYDSDDTFGRLASVLDEVDHTLGTAGNRLYYLAVPPTAFATILASLGRHSRKGPKRRRLHPFVRVVIEKPYGRDLQSAQELDQCVHRVFDESEVYRIDHYLGKETVQNLLALRFANIIFEPIWDQRYVDSVQVTVAESDGVGNRGGFYEQTGALRDIVQNHVMQVLALTVMEPPVTLEGDSIRDEKVKALRAVVVPPVNSVRTRVVRAQYGEGWIAGRRVRGYRHEPDVAPASTTETYVALKLELDNWRWAGVPFYIRAGKRLPKRATEIVIQFRRVPHLPFKPYQIDKLEPNALVVHVQPDEGITLTVGSKVPGRGFDVRSVSMDFLYGAAFPQRMGDAYERLLLDALIGDQTLFLRADEVMQAWRILAPFQEAFGGESVPLAQYEAGTWGPAAGDDLVGRDGRRWHNP